MRSETDVEHTIDYYADMIQRICICYLKNSEDSEDLFQNVFIRYMMYDGTFESEEHRKAWLIRVTVNACKDYLRTCFWKKGESLSVLSDTAAFAEAEHLDVLSAVRSLPEKYRTVIFLHYYEGYTAREIADILETKENTVYSILSRGRQQLKDILGGDIDE